MNAQRSQYDQQHETPMFEQVSMSSLSHKKPMSGDCVKEYVQA